MSRFPRTSPWGEVQHCEIMRRGVFMVTTAIHGGIMVRKTKADFLSDYARKIALKDRNYLYFEKNCDEQLAIRELLDKKLYEIPERIMDKNIAIENINRSVKSFHPKYWEIRQKSLSAQTIGIENKNMISVEKVKITNEEMLIDTAKNTFDIQKIKNRRFMYNPQTGTLILGRHYAGNKMLASHAEEHGQLGVKEPFDNFIRGWVGTGGQYTNGVIHFAPQIPKNNPELFDKGFSTLELFARNGAVNQTVIRGFVGAWEQPLGNIVKCKSAIKKPPTLAERLESGKQKAAVQNAERELSNISRKDKKATEH